MNIICNINRYRPTGHSHLTSSIAENICVHEQATSDLFTWQMARASRPSRFPIRMMSRQDARVIEDKSNIKRWNAIVMTLQQRKHFFLIDASYVWCTREKEVQSPLSTKKEKWGMWRRCFSLSLSLSLSSHLRKCSCDVYVLWKTSNHIRHS